MDDKQVQQLALEVANQSAHHNWEYWLALLGVALIAAAAGYLGSYFAKRGEYAAADADLKKILRQVDRTTRTTESIKSFISLGEWSERERRTLRRIKLEELMVTAHGARDWLENESRRQVWLSGEPEVKSPLPLLVTLGKLFFPELRDAVFTYQNASSQHRLLLGRVHGALLAGKGVAFDEVTQGPLGKSSDWEHHVDIHAGRAFIRIREEFQAQMLESDAAAYQALLDLGEAAATLMESIIATPETLQAERNSAVQG